MITYHRTKCWKKKKQLNWFVFFCGKRNWLWILQLWFDACFAHNTLSVCNMIERNGSSWCTFIIPIFLLFCCFSFILNTFIVVSWGSVCVCMFAFRTIFIWFSVCILCSSFLLLLLLPLRFRFSFIHHRIQTAPFFVRLFIFLS